MTTDLMVPQRQVKLCMFSVSFQREAEKKEAFDIISFHLFPTFDRL